MGNTVRLLAAVCVLLTALTAQSQEAGSPRLIRCAPDSITSGMSIKLSGYRIGGVVSKVVKVLFVQHDNTYSASPHGGGIEDIRDFQNALGHVSLIVPEGLKPGKCQIIIEADGVPSAPLTIEIASSIPPPVIGKANPLVAPPGELIWFEALGIGESDEVLLIDSQGQTHHIPSHPTSEGIQATFYLPADLPDGEATFHVVETRSGFDQPSNSLSLRVDVSPAPLDIYIPDNARSLAPGQWIDATVLNRIAAERAARIEVAFTQNELVIVPIRPFRRDTNFRLHARVPTSLVAGQVKVTTRTWLKGRPSSWSEPLELELLDHPAAPYLWNISISTPKGTDQLIDFVSFTAETLKAHSGDTVVLSGLFMVESASRLRIKLEGPGQNFDLPLSETGDQASVSFKIPRKPRSGEWQMVVTNLDKAVSVKVPITLVIE